MSTQKVQSIILKSNHTPYSLSIARSSLSAPMPLHKYTHHEAVIATRPGGWKRGHVEPTASAHRRRSAAPPPWNPAADSAHATRQSPAGSSFAPLIFFRRSRGSTVGEGDFYSLRLCIEGKRREEGRRGKGAQFEKNGQVILLFCRFLTA